MMAEKLLGSILEARSLRVRPLTFTNTMFDVSVLPLGFNDNHRYDLRAYLQ